MDRIEMFQKLKENPKRKASYKGDIVYVSNTKSICWESDLCPLVALWRDDEDWEIIEPIKELKELSFVEAINILLSVYTAYSMTSLVTLSIHRHDSQIFNLDTDEVNGKWVIDGIYKD